MKPPAVSVNPFDIGLVVVGVILMGIGIHRMLPIRLDRMFWTMNGPLVIMLAATIFFLAQAHQDTTASMTAAVRLVRMFLPLMVLLVLVMATGGVLAKIHEKAITAFIEKHHILGPLVASFLTPTSNSLVGVVESLWKTPSLQPMCLFYLQASAMMSIPLFMLRRIGFGEGSPLPLRMYLTGLIVSIFMFPFVRPIAWAVETALSFWNKH